jgi:hypothetical protein
MTLTIGSYTLDANPLHNAGIAALASWCRNAFIFLIALFSLRGAWNCVQEYLANMGAIRQASASDDVPVAGTVSALIMAGIITTVCAALPAYVTTWGGQSGFMSALANGLFQNSSAAIGTGISLLDAFVPLDYAVSASVSVLIFRVTVGGIYFSILTIVRWLVG